MAAYNANFVTTSITRSGTTATATFTAHGLVNGAQVVVTGAFPTLYNGTYTISGVAANTFNYTMASDPGGSATVQGLVNVADIDAFGIAATNDSLSIINNGLIVAQTNQNRLWAGISVVQGRLWVKNASTTVGNRFCMGRETGTGHCLLACGSQLGTIQVDGAWISLGTGTGAQQDVTSPFPQVGSGFDYIPVLWVETAPGSGEYEAWFNCIMSYGEAVWKYLREDLAALIPNAKKGKFFRQIPLDETTINPATTPGNCHFTSTIRFGEAGNMVPSGCNIRCHNIYITRSDLTNHIDSGGNLSGFGQGSGNYLLSNCIVGDMTWLTTNCSILSLTDVDFCIPPAWGAVYEANLTRCAVHSGHANLWYDTSTTPAQWKVRDRRHVNFAPTSLPGLTMTGCYWLDRFNLNNSPGATLTDCENNSTIRSTSAQIGLAISSSPNSTVTDLRLRNSALNIAAGSEITVDGWDVDMGMFNESTGFASAVGSQNTNTPRFGALPNGTRFVNGTPYYFKIRNYYAWWDVGNASFYWDSPITYSATPYSGRLDAADNSDAHPYWFGCALSVIANAWTVQLAWNNISALLPFTKYQIFKSTIWSTLGTQLGADISTASTVATTDATLTNNTTYYYTLRYFRNATDYTDSAQQVVIVPNYTPTAANYLSAVTNLCLQSTLHATASWLQHSANNCVVANNGRQWLRDVNPAAPSLYTCSKVTFHATLVSGLKQTIAVTNGQTYAIMIRLAGDNVSADAVNVILSATTGTTSTMNCLVKRSATEYVLYHTASSASLVLAYYSDASSYGKVIYIDASLTLGNYRSPYLNTTTAAVTASAYIELASAGACRIQAMSKGGRKLIEIGYSLIPANVLFNETYCDTDPNFTPSKENMICSTVATQNTGILNPSGVSDDVVIKNVTARCRVATEITGGAISGPVYVSGGLQTNWVLSDWTVDLGWMSERATVAGQSLAFWSDFIISDWAISNARGHYSYLGSSQVACNKTTYANVVADAADLHEVLIPSSGQQIKGCSSGWVGTRTDTVNSLIFGQIGGIQSPTVQFDSIFNELFLESATEGLMHVNFVPSVLAAKPYTISGSGMVFDNNNSLYMMQAADSIVYRWPWRLKGITGWQNKRYVVNSVNLGYNASTAFGVLVEYRLSTDGITYGAWKEMIWANTSSEDLNDAYMDLRLTVKQHFRFVTKVSNFVVDETIQNATSSPTATAVVRAIETDPTTATAGTIWVDTITGTWQYTDPIWIAGTRRATMQGDVTFGATYPNIASRITGLAWYTTTDRTKKYPTSYCNIALSNLGTGTLVTAFDSVTGAWDETTSSGAGSTADLAVPWYTDGNITLKILKSGYEDDTRTVPITRFGTSIVGAQVAWTRIAAGDPGALAITFTDHAGSPVTWNSKQWRYSLVVTDGSTAAQIAQWWYYNRAAGGTISGFRGDALPPLIIEDSGTAYETQIGAITGVATAAGGMRIVDGSANPISGFTRMQSNDGTYWSPPVVASASITGIVSGSKVRIYNVTENAETYIGTPGTSYATTYTDGTGYTTGDSVQVTIHKRGYLTFQTTVVASAGGWVVGADQQVDDVYTTLAIDGSAVTGFAADYVFDEVNVTVASNFNIADMYAWWNYNLESNEGIRYFVAGMTAIDQANFRINNANVDIYIDNTTATNLRQLDNRRIYRADGAYPVKSSGGGGIDVVWRNTILLAETGVSGLTPTEAAELSAAASMSMAIEGSYTAAQLMRLSAAALLGKASGQPTAPVFRDINDTENRVTATVDTNGNRTAVTLNP